MNARFSFMIAVVLVPLWVGSGCRREESPFVPIQPPPGEAALEHLPRHWSLPEFNLTERSGRSIGLADLKGKVWVADFFYTTCPGPCPMLSSRLSALENKIREMPDVRLVSISTDPVKDTPEVLKQYAETFHAGPNWLFLTGEKKAIFDLANDGFKLSVAEERNSPEPIVHSTKLVLVDRAGTVRGFYEGVGEDQTAQLLADIEELRREPSP